MKNSSMKTQWSDLKIEQYLLGELSEKEMNQMTMDLSRDADLAKRIQELEAENEALRSPMKTKRMPLTKSAVMIRSGREC